MIQMLSYSVPPGLPVDKISVIGDFNNWNPDSHVMERNDGDFWCIELDLPSGEHKYRFLINDTFSFNDPNANIYYPLENEALTSVIIINENGQRMVNTQKYSLNIDSYCLSADIEESGLGSNIHLFFMPQDEKIVCRLGFTNVTGIHTVSVLWYKPGMEFFDMTENSLWTSEEAKNEPIMMWFWVDSSRYELCQGRWVIKIFIDGKYIFEDCFDVNLSGEVLQDISKFSEIFEDAVIKSTVIGDISIPEGSNELSFDSLEKTGKSKSVSGDLNEILDLISYSIETETSSGDKSDAIKDSDISEASNILEEIEEIQSGLNCPVSPEEPVKKSGTDSVQNITDIFDSIGLVSDKKEEEKEKCSDTKLPEL